MDGERWFSTKLYYYLLKEAEYLHENVDRSLPYHEYWEAHTKAGPAACAYASKYGFMDVDSIMLCIHNYLNVYNVRECLDSGIYILKLLAVLDRRIGKRTVKKLATIFPVSRSGFRNLSFFVQKVRGFIAGQNWIVKQRRMTERRLLQGTRLLA